MIAGELTGPKVLMMFVSGFSIVIAVNVTMAVNAVRTFPGLEVKNSYIASQSFDQRRAAQEALGWDARATYEDGVLAVSLVSDGQPISTTNLIGRIGRPTTRLSDTRIAFDTAGEFDVDLAPGRWRLDLQSADPAVPFERILLLEVPE